MQVLVLSHRYGGSYVTDLSGHRNHGFAMELVSTSSPPGFTYTSPGSKVYVAPSPTLSTFVGVTATCQFQVAAGTPPRRLNLVEGYLSFALFINPDRSVSATILDQDGNWTGATSVSALIADGVSYSAALRHDGISTMQLLLGGSVISSSPTVNGAIRPVGEKGLVIGHWPDADADRTFAGVISAVDIWTGDPASDAAAFLSGCCVDRGALDQLFQAWLAQAGDRDAISKYFAALVGASMTVMREARRVRSKDLQELLGLERLVVLAVLRRRADLFTAADGGLATDANASPALAAAVAALESLIEQCPLTPEELDQAAKALCLEFLLAEKAAGK
jgi:hypothetical protein